MAQTIAVTPLYGARDRGPKCTLLEVGGMRLLLDCGWSDALLEEGHDANASTTTAAIGGGTPSTSSSSSSSALARATKAARTAHALLLSHADLEHLGALAAVAKALPKRSKILATVPTHRLGQLALYDAALARERAGCVALPGCELELLRESEEKEEKEVEEEEAQEEGAEEEEEEEEEDMEEEAKAGEGKAEKKKKKPLLRRPRTPPKNPPPRATASTAAQRRRAAVEAIDAAFSRVVALKYRQSFQLAVGEEEEEEEEEEEDEEEAEEMDQDDGVGEKGKKVTKTPSSLPLESFTLTPHCAGHTLGGCLWEIVPPGGDTLLYAPAVNHRRERHLDAAALPSFARPALLIAGAGVPPLPISFQQKQVGGAGGERGDAAAAAAGAQSSSSSSVLAPRDPPPAEREADLIEACLRALRREGSVLIPAPTAGRATEVLLALDAAWTANRYPYPLALASAVAVSTLEFTRSLVEWMGEGITSRQQQQNQQNNQQQQQQDHAASLRAVRPCHSAADVARLPRGPKVVVASLSSLDAGVARELLVEWAGNPNCAVVFPGQPPRGSLAERLVEGSLRNQGRQQFLAQQAQALQQQMQGLQQQMQYNNSRGGGGGPQMQQQQQQQQHYYFLQQQLGQLQQQMQQLSVDLSVSLAHHVPLEGAELAAWQEASEKKKEEEKEEKEGGGDKAKKGKARASSASGPLRTSVASIGGATAAVAAVPGSATGPGGEPALVPDAEASEMEAVGSDAAPEDDPSVPAAAAVPASDVLIDGFAVPEGAAAPMFPEDVDDPDASSGGGEEKNLGPRSWDEYGAEARVGDVAASGTEGGAEGAGDAAAADLDLPGGIGIGEGSLDDLTTDASGALALALAGVSSLGRAAISAGFTVPESNAATGGFGGRFPAPPSAAPPAAAAATTAAARLAVPTVLSTSTARLRVRASVHVAALDGLADARALRNMIAAVAPRHLVLLGAEAGDEDDGGEKDDDGAATETAEEKQRKPVGTLRALADAAALDLARERASVHTPRDGEAADASKGAASRRVALSSAALASVALRPAGDVAVGWLDGVYAAPDVPGGAVRIVPAAVAEEAGGEAAAAAAAVAARREEEDEDRRRRRRRTTSGRLVVALSPSAALLPPIPSTNGENDDSGGAFIGDVRLSDLRLALGAAGVRSAFSGGTLVCGRAKIVVARATAAAALSSASSSASAAAVAAAAAADGEILVEGPLCEEYYRVRDVVYGQYTAS